ncbi:MAG: polymerase subunit gamma and tau, partial [Alphaproteobacteria bacterium]|nr:polymerase subunit gamma and tau [Alphaproteobacteria bacterium]
MSAYRALARKYRSRHFGELIGQEALVRTLTHAIENNRLHHAYMFTGIRGTGKTSTARILAKAINYVGKDGMGKPTIGPTDDCAICQAIGEDRHPDVIEIDAASNTGVDDVRQIIENVRYAPVQARYKVFIIDEVHMLSKAAFNALLKTLEEPPPHVIFMLATTEIRKVPATILSRCQRFDLRRIEVPVLVAHYKKIAEM